MHLYWFQHIILSETKDKTASPSVFAKHVQSYTLCIVVSPFQQREYFPRLHNTHFPRVEKLHEATCFPECQITTDDSFKSGVSSVLGHERCSKLPLKETCRFKSVSFTQVRYLLETSQLTPFRCLWIIITNNLMLLIFTSRAAFFPLWGSETKS